MVLTSAHGSDSMSMFWGDWLGRSCTFWVCQKGCFAAQDKFDELDRHSGHMLETAQQLTLERMSTTNFATEQSILKAASVPTTAMVIVIKQFQISDRDRTTYSRSTLQH